MKKPLSVPKFKNEEEEFEFWSNLDLSEYFEPSDFKQVVFPNLKRTKRKMISMRLPLPLIEEAKAKANKLDVPYQRLMEEVLRQGITSLKI